MSESDNIKAPPKAEARQNLIEELVEQIKSRNTLFCDQRQDAYIALDKKGGKIFQLNSEDFRKWLRNTIIRKYKMYVGLDHVVEVARTMLLYEAETNGVTHELHTRLCRTNDQHGNPSEITYDVGDGAHAISVTPEGWSIQNVPIAFRHHKHQKAQYLPQRHNDCSLEPLRELLSEVDDRDWIVIMAYIVSLYVPDLPKPLLSISGDEGSGKTLSVRRMVNLVEPSSSEKGLSEAAVRSSQELLRQANKNAVLFLDNLSHISMSSSDELSRICTGTSFTKRMLYENDEDWFCEVCCPVIITGIPSTMIRMADLLDRTILIKVGRIPEAKYRTQSRLDTEFARLKPYLLGSIYNILSKALKLLPSVNLEKLPRLADWFQLGYAICESMDGHSGQEFIDAYQRVLDRKTDMVIESSVVSQACRLLVSQTGKWEGTASQLHEIKLVHDDREHTEDHESRCYLLGNPSWPRTPATLSKELDRCKVTLESIGIKVKRGYYKFGQRWIELVDTKWAEAEKPTQGENQTQ